MSIHNSLAMVMLLAVQPWSLCAQNTYNYSQSYSSMNNVLAKQQAEWRATEQHYRNISSSNRSSGSYTSSSGGSGGYDQGTVELFERMFFPKRYAREQARKREAAYKPPAQKSSVSYFRDESTPAVSQADLAKERREAAERAALERQARKDLWVKKLEADPLQTIEEPPSFVSKQAMFEWYFDKAIRGNDIFREDPYAKLVAARMLWDGEATKGLSNRMGDTAAVVSFVNEAPVCGLRYCLSAEILMAEKEGAKYISNILNGFQIATRLRDKTQGDVRAYKHLLALYRQGSLFGKPLPREMNFVADTYAWAARQGDAKARQDLMKILEDSGDVAEFPYFHLQNIAKTFDPNTPEGFWNLRAQAEMIRRDHDDLDSLDATSMDGWIKSTARMEAQALQKTLQLFNTYQLQNKPLHKDMYFAAEVYLQAAGKGDEAARQQLVRLVPAVPMSRWNANQLLMLKKVLPGTTMQDDYALWAMLEKGRQQQAAGDSACFSSYRQAFTHPNQGHRYTQAMLCRALYLCLNDPRFTNRLSQAEFVKAHKAAQAYMPVLEETLKKTDNPAKDDIQLLFGWQAGHMMNAASPAKAASMAVRMAIEGNYGLVKEAGIHYRWGKNGWPKNDSLAMAYFDMALIPLKNNNTNREGAARLAETHAEMAGYWGGFPNAAILPNHDQRHMHLQAAASLDNRYQWLYAQFLAEKTPYQNRTKAAEHAQKAMAHLEKIKGLLMMMDDPTLTAQADKKLAEMQQFYNNML